MNNYLISVIGITLLLSLFELLFSNGKNFKLVKNIITVICVLLIISPLLKLINFDYDITEISPEENYVLYLEKYEGELTENNIKYLLKNNNIEVESVKVDGNLIDGKYKINEIYIKLKNYVINESLEHIHIIEKINELITSRLYLSEAKIIIE